jgi:hypothetical protein
MIPEILIGRPIKTEVNEGALVWFDYDVQLINNDWEIPEFLRQPARGLFPKIENALKMIGKEIPQDWQVRRLLNAIALQSSLIAAAKIGVNLLTISQLGITLIDDPDLHHPDGTIDEFGFIVRVNNNLFVGQIYTGENFGPNYSGLLKQVSVYQEGQPDPIASQVLTRTDLVDENFNYKENNLLIPFLVP